MLLLYYCVPSSSRLCDIVIYIYYIIIMHTLSYLDKTASVYIGIIRHTAQYINKTSYLLVRVCLCIYTCTYAKNDFSEITHTIYDIHYVGSKIRAWRTCPGRVCIRGYCIISYYRIHSSVLFFLAIFIGIHEPVNLYECLIIVYNILSVYISRVFLNQLTSNFLITQPLQVLFITYTAISQLNIYCAIQYLFIYQ